VQKKSKTDSTSVYDDICGGETVTNGIGQALASLYAKDQANTALLDSFYELGERAEKWVAWLNDGNARSKAPDSSHDIMRGLAEAYKDATNP